MKIKERIIRFVNKPEDHILSSQTLYESLLATLDLYEMTREEYWKSEAYKISKMIVDTQLPSGGFDIGYNFMFGNGLKKKAHKEATTPEVVSIYALYRYGEIFGFGHVVGAIYKGAKWIIKHSIKVSKNMYAIPYAPHSYSKIHITNAVSFTVGVLAYYLKFNKDQEVAKIYKGMITFMNEQLEENEFGFYWPYFYRNGNKEERALTNDKIDNYHIGQQLKYHCSAYNNYPTKENLEIIEKVSHYLINKIDDKGILSYTEKEGKTSSKIDLWGYSSVVKGLIEAYHILNKVELLTKAKKIVQFIMENAWNESYFYPIINKDGSVFDQEFYPRSDAWVIHSLTHYMKHTGFDKSIYDSCIKSYKKISDQNFRGLENHTLTNRKKLFAALVHFIKKVINKGESK